MSITKYPLKIRLLKDRYPDIKGSEFGIEIINRSEIMNRKVMYKSKLGTEISPEETENTNWFEPIPEQQTPIEEEISDKLTPLMETAFKVLDDGVKQLKGLKTQGWDEFKKRMKKIIEEDEKKG